MRKQLQNWKYIPYFLSHPINGFWEIKKEKKGSLTTAMTILVLYGLVSVMSAFFTSYMFNPYNTLNVNIALLLLPTAGLYLLWCISSWCLTSLFDGEGSFTDICIATAYSMIPLLIVDVLLILLSYGLTLDESCLYYMIRTISFVWFGFMMFVGTMVTHQYSFSKTLLICICTLLGMCIIVYIALLFINLLQQLTGFGSSLYNEWLLRMN